MLIPCPPISNAERQRQFRERNPGYYGRLHARRRAGIKAALARRAAAERAIADATAEPLALPARPQPLLLPAPVEVVEIPGMTIPAIGAFAAMPAPSPLPVSSEATISQTTTGLFAASRR